MKNWCKNWFCQNRTALRYFCCSNYFTTKFYCHQLGDPQMNFWCPAKLLVPVRDWAMATGRPLVCIPVSGSLLFNIYILREEGSKSDFYRFRLKYQVIWVIFSAFFFFFFFLLKKISHDIYMNIEIISKKETLNGNLCPVFCSSLSKNRKSLIKV